MFTIAGIGLQRATYTDGGTQGLLRANQTERPYSVARTLAEGVAKKASEVAGAVLYNIALAYAGVFIYIGRTVAGTHQEPLNVNSINRIISYAIVEIFEDRQRLTAL